MRRIKTMELWRKVSDVLNNIDLYGNTELRHRSHWRNFTDFRLRDQNLWEKKILRTVGVDRGIVSFFKVAQKGISMTHPVLGILKRMFYMTSIRESKEKYLYNPMFSDVWRHNRMLLEVRLHVHRYLSIAINKLSTRRATSNSEND